MIDMKNFLTSFGSVEEMFLAYAEGNFSVEEEQIFDQLLEDNPLLSKSFIDFGSSYSESASEEIYTPVEKDIQMIADYRKHFDIDSILSVPCRFESLEHLHSIEYLIAPKNGIYETAGSVGKTVGSVGETAGSVGETAGSVGETAGSVGETAGSVGTILVGKSGLKHEMAEGPMQVGEAPINGHSSYVKQGYSDTCAINAQKIILDAYGKSFTEEELIRQAIENGLYTEGKGTSLDNMGELLNLNDCPCTNYVFGNVADLTRALAEGKMVMMAVDSGELWTESKSLIGRVWEKIEDYIPFINGADHALLVTGIDARDPNNVLVVVTDPGSGDLNKTYPIEQFVDAAKDSLFFMTITDNPKPHVFDSFAQDNIQNLPQIGAMTYEDFIKDYSIYFGSNELMPSNIIEQYSSAILGKTYGYESNTVPAKENFYPDVYQGNGNTCAIDAQMLVMRDYGIIIPKEDLINYAIYKGWFDPDPKEGGTPKEHVGNLLDEFTLKTTRTEDATIYDIIGELRAGHRVIVSVDANELWVKNEPNLFKKLFGNVINKVNDGIQSVLDKEGANHALIVAGVNVNPDDPSDIKVTLIDTGSGEVCIEYKYKDFYNAWKDGRCLMVSTQEAAPYQYNYQTDMIEPSGIETSFVPALITLPQGLNNEFRLHESFYNYTQEPTYTYKNLLWNDKHTDYPELDSFMQRIGLHDSHVNNLGESVLPDYINDGKYNDGGNPNVLPIKPLHQPGEEHSNINSGSDDITQIHPAVPTVHIKTPETYVPPTTQPTGIHSPIYVQHMGNEIAETPGSDLPGTNSNGTISSDHGISESGDSSSSDVNM